MRIIPSRLIGPIALMIAVQVLPQSVHKPNDVSSGDLDLQEAVIRYQIKSWQQEMHTYCVEINGTDPDPALLQRLRPLKVKGASACHRQNDRQLMMIVDDKKKDSVIFNLVAFRKVSESEVEIEGGYFCGNLCMAQGTYHLVRGASGWHVVRFEARLTL
ncbi:MAG: hypothetical protein WCA10_17970 [Terracidiphilus sp.]